MRENACHRFFISSLIEVIHFVNFPEAQLLDSLILHLRNPSLDPTTFGKFLNPRQRMITFSKLVAVTACVSFTAHLFSEFHYPCRQLCQWNPYNSKERRFR